MDWIDRISGVVTVVASLIGGYIYIDEHYASAADVQTLRKEFKADSIDQRKKQIEDKIFELEFKQRSGPQNFKPIDEALLNRYKREMQDLRDKERQNR